MSVEEPAASVVAASATAYQVQPPEPFTFTRPADWPKWLRRFKRFKTASGLAEKADIVQVNTFLYSMGDEADDILRSFNLTEAQQAEYAVVKERFNSQFVRKRNVIFERAKFNMRKQEEGESVDAFVTDLYVLAEHCSYGALHDEMIRDRLVVGLRSARLSEKLQLDAELTLEKAITLVRQSEEVRLQQAVLRGEGTAKCVINHMQSIFARFGVPEIVVSDNGPQYSSEAFSNFATEYGFQHLTSSPLYPQSNGEAERAVRTTDV